jgi:hypothetical protein
VSYLALFKLSYLQSVALKRVTLFVLSSERNLENPAFIMSLLYFVPGLGISILLRSE